MLKAALINREVEKGRALDDTESRQVVTALVKQRRDSIEQFTQGRPPGSGGQGSRRNRRARIVPAAAADPAAVERAVTEAIAETGAASPKDMGRVMKAVDGEAAGPERRRKDGQRAGPQETGGSLDDRRAVVANSRSRGPQAWPAAATLTSRILGLARDQVLAALFGAGNEMDAFIVAFRIPESGARPVRRGRDERRVRPDLHARPHGARGKPTRGGSATTS